MKNCMPNLSEKCSDSFTFARLTHQHRSAGMPSGKLASFFFLGLQSWSEQGTLMAAKRGRWKKGIQTMVVQNYLVVQIFL
jgi:hypothetical protein